MSLSALLWWISCCCRIEEQIAFFARQGVGYKRAPSLPLVSSSWLSLIFVCLTIVGITSLASPCESRIAAFYRPAFWTCFMKSKRCAMICALLVSTSPRMNLTLLCVKIKLLQVPAKLCLTGSWCVLKRLSVPSHMSIASHVIVYSWGISYHCFYLSDLRRWCAL